MSEAIEKLKRMRQHAVAIFQSGLQAVAPGDAIRAHCRRKDDRLVVNNRCYDLDQFETILVLGVGKAGASMAKAVEQLLGDRISSGIVIIKYGHLEKLQRMSLREAGHPVPDENGMNAAREILEAARGADEKTLVIFLVSGGGSALMPLPVDGVSLVDKQNTTRALLASGATIHEINTIRKHLSGIKGGQLAQAIFPATLISLVLSDVIGDDLDTIASGPCVPDSGTFKDCIEIIDRYGIDLKLPASVKNYLHAGVRGEVPETPKQGDNVFEKTFNMIIGNNFNALFQANNMAESLGYNTLILSSAIEGETIDVAGVHMALVREILKSGHPLPTPACLLSGGETTVTIKGPGLGGRNQEFALAAARHMGNSGQIMLLSAGTDGTDGPTDAAGAFADSSTSQRAEFSGLSLQAFLDANDSYHFFEQLGDLYKTGPTNTNVMDLRVILVNS
jgi:glycerate 2-kinase